MRKLATIRTITDIRPIEGADLIVCAIVDGWSVVIRAGEFQVGDPAIFVEIDSWVPHEIAPQLSKGQEPRVYEGIPGNRLRTVRLRKQLSQGLLLPVSLLGGVDITPGDDVAEHLGIIKWEAPIAAQLAGYARGNFPEFIPKTDQERCQNLVSEIRVYHGKPFLFEVTEKLDGSSMTVYVRDEDQGVCSRNMDLKETEENTFWAVARQFELIDRIRSTGRNLALQGELIGEGVQKNRYGIRGHQFKLFDVYDIDAGAYLLPAERLELAKTLEIDSVPVITLGTALSSPNVDELLIEAEGKSVLNAKTEREGVVYKAIDDSTIHFKAISNRFLLKGGD